MKLSTEDAPSESARMRRERTGHFDIVRVQRCAATVVVLLGVGAIGADSNISWGTSDHLPALTDTSNGTAETGCQLGGSGGAGGEPGQPGGSGGAGGQPGRPGGSGGAGGQPGQPGGSGGAGGEPGRPGGSGGADGQPGGCGRADG